MADLDPLIRYRKHTVDEKRRALSALYKQAETLEKQKQQILDQIRSEKELAQEAQDKDTSAFLGNYLEGARKKIAALDESLGKMETRIAVAQEDMRAAFAELKKVEITQRQRAQRAEDEANKKEDAEIDSVAIENYRRQGEDTGD